MLVEDSSDLIFSIDLSGRILSMNHASRKLLGHSPDQLRGRSIFSLLHEAVRESQGYDLMRLRDAVQQIGNSVLQTRVRFSSKTGEPVSLALRLERIGAGERGEGLADGLILGKATLDEDDVLAACVTAEHGSYTIENYLNLSDLVHQRITRSLARYFDHDSCDEITLVLREMLMNAIEHGNLEISYAEKTEAQRDGTYMQLIRDRQKVEPYKSRRVTVEFSLNHKRVWFRISDEGNGFDHEAMRAGEEERMRSLQESHGRGIALARVLFDVVRYNEKGNSVILAKLTTSRLTPQPH